MKIKLKSNLCTLVVVAIILFLLKSYYISYEHNVFLEFQSVDEGLEYQIFYSENENESFSELKSVKVNTIKHDVFTNNVVSLGNLQYVHSIRIDVGGGDNKIWLKNVKITDGKKNKIFTNKELIDTKNGDFDSVYTKNDYVVVNTKANDPFFAIEELNFTPKNTMRIDYFRLINMFLLLYLLIFAIALWLVKQKLSLKEKIMYGYVVVFLVIIAIFPLHINNNKIDIVENRTLNQMPTFEEIKKLEVKKLEGWYNDHFGLRDKYISLKNRIYNQKIVAIPFLDPDIRNKENSGIAFRGKENWSWLIIDNSIFNYTNVERYKKEELKTIKNNLESIQAYFKEKKINLYFYIAPDKNQIYPEYYPDYIVRQSDYSKTDQLVDYLNESNSKQKIIYSKEKFLFAKENNCDLLYWKANTHWNQYGAYLGYQEIMEEIKKEHPQVPILKESDLEVTYQPNNEGDLSKKNPALIEMYRGYNIIDNAPFEYVKNNEREGVVTKNDSKDLDIVMFRDSFTSSLIPYLSSSFNNCEYIWSSDIKSNLAVIEKNKPDIVIIEIVERYTKAANSFDRFNMKGIN